jgi:predicted SnoaL-like aldol condensation-catalyzing enzyme
MIEIVNLGDRRAVRNKDNVLAWVEMMINQKRPREAVAKYVSPTYIQHNPLIATGPDGLADYFSSLTKERERARAEMYRIIAVDEWVWTHGRFFNFFDDDPNDTGIAVVDIYRMDEDGRAAEHWDVLQLVGDPETNAAPFAALGLQAQNSNGVL